MNNNQEFETNENFEYLEVFLLDPILSLRETLASCGEARSYQIPLIWVKPCYVLPAIEVLKGANINIGTIIGYPYGVNVTHVKISEAKQALIDGVTSLAMVINYGYVFDGKRDLIEKDIQAVCGLSHMNGVPFSLFLDCEYLSREQFVNIIPILSEVCVDGVILSGKAVDLGNYVNLIKDVVKIEGDRFSLTGMAQNGSLNEVKNLLDSGFDRVGLSHLSNILKDFGLK
jgi:deoxyribose-phosphate aldolase